MSTTCISAAAASALGFLELGRGRPLAALPFLDAVATAVDDGGVAEPGALWYAGDLIEVHWRLGDLGAARRRYEVLAGQADATGRRWAVAVADRARGLLAAAAAFLQRAAELTPDPALRSDRSLEAAQAKLDVADAAAASVLLEAAALGPLPELQRARLERLRAQIVFTNERGNNAPKLVSPVPR